MITAHECAQTTRALLGSAAAATSASDAGDLDRTRVVDGDLGRALDALLLALGRPGTRLRVVASVEQVAAQGGFCGGSGLLLVTLLVTLEDVFPGEPFGTDGADKVLSDAVLG